MARACLMSCVCRACSSLCGIPVQSRAWKSAGHTQPCHSVSRRRRGTSLLRRMTPSLEKVLLASASRCLKVSCSNRRNSMTAPRYTCCETVLRNNTWSPIVNLKSSGLVVDHCVSLQYLGCLGSLQFQNDNRLFLTDYQAVSEKAGQDVLHGPIGPLQVFAFTNCPALCSCWLYTCQESGDRTFA